MKKVKYTVDLTKLNLSDQEKASWDQAGLKKVFEVTLINAISQRYKDGIGGEKQRSFGRVLEELDKTQDDFLILEDREVEFLKGVLADESARFQPQQTRLVMQYINALEDAKPVEATGLKLAHC